MSTCDYYVNPFADEGDENGGLGNKPALLRMKFRRKEDGLIGVSYRCEEHATDTNDKWECLGVEPES